MARHGVRLKKAWLKKWSCLNWVCFRVFFAIDIGFAVGDVAVAANLLCRQGRGFCF